MYCLNNILLLLKDWYCTYYVGGQAFPLACRAGLEKSIRFPRDVDLRQEQVEMNNSTHEQLSQRYYVHLQQSVSFLIA